MNVKRVCYDCATAAAILGVSGIFVWTAFAVLRRSQAVESRPPAETQSARLTVQVAELVPQDINSSLQRRGVVGPGARVEVVAEATARVQTRHVQVGDHVAEGDPLFVLDNARSTIQFEAAEAERDSAQALLAEAEAELKAARETDDEDLQNQTKARRDAAEASVRLANTRLTEAQIAQQRCTISAPLAGVVAQCFVDAGEFAADGRPVAEIVSTDPVQVTLVLTAQELEQLGHAQATWQVVVDGDRAVDATVRFTSPVADPLTKRFDQVLEVANSDGRLMIGAKVDVLCKWQGQQPMLTMPRRAVVLRDQGLACYRIVRDGDKDVCRETPIRIASIPGLPETVHVLEGLQRNDRVATARLLNLRDGLEVDVQRQGGAVR